MSFQWRIYHADLNPTTGSEQAGKRPVLVISAEPLNARYDVIMVAPITSRKEGRPARLGEVFLPNGTGGLPRESFVLCYQVRALYKSRLGRLYGEISDVQLQKQIRDMLADCFDID